MAKSRIPTQEHAKSPASAWQPRRFAQERPHIRGQIRSIFPNRKGALSFVPLPGPRSNMSPYHLALDTVLPRGTISSIEKNGIISFHTVGDTGGINGTQYEEINANAMVADINNSDRPAPPSFFYHLGDVVYYAGEAVNYPVQFYEPYKDYPAPIFAIPGNHDGIPSGGDQSTSLAAFVDNFCAASPHPTKDAGDIPRDAMTQPYVYWTLDAPFLTIVGLYSNVLENGGEFDNTQKEWFSNELSKASRNKALIVAVHHPAYSADVVRGGSRTVAKTIDDAFNESGRIADLVLSGHVHNYQRYTRSLGKRQIPYIVAGAGGYASKHPMQRHPLGNKIEVPYRMPDKGVDLILEHYCEDRFGYMLLEVTQKLITGKYYATAYHNEPQHSEVTQVDTFELDWQNHTLNLVGKSN